MMREVREGVQGAGQGEKHWYALYTKPHKEYLVQGVLQGKGVEVYLPQIPVAVQRRDRRSMKPFLPHYLFARFDPEGQRFADVCWTPGLRCIVCAGRQPVIVPDEVVVYLRHRLQKMEGETEPEAPFKKGEVVRIIQGPLEGLEAIFDKQISSRGRVRVFLQVMKRLVRTELDLADLL